MQIRNILLSLSILTGISSAENNNLNIVPQDTVVITGTRIARGLKEMNRNVTVISNDEIKTWPVNSVAQVLSRVAGVDIQTRGSRGMQADVTMRGSTFEQVLVMVDGVRMNDPQTGHHNLDIPFELADIDRIEVLRGNGSSVYGPDAFGGVINIISANPEKRGFSSQAGYAEHATYFTGASYAFKTGPVSNRISAAYRGSNGYSRGTDFQNLTLNNRIIVETGKLKSDFSLGLMDKEFGAYHFYSIYIDDDREWTRTAYANLKNRYTVDQSTVINTSLQFRQHDDRYRYTYSGLWYENEHTAYSYGADIHAVLKPAENNTVVAGAGANADIITSTNLGDHEQKRYSAYAEYSGLFINRLGIDAGLRLDAHTEWGLVVSPTLSFGYWAHDRFRLRLSGGYAFRRPTFNDLYLSGGGNQGNADLVPERSLSGEAGVDCLFGTHLSVSFTSFVRMQKDLIDWVKYLPADTKWSADNIGDRNLFGQELSFNATWGISRLQGSYTLLDAEKEYRSR